MKTIMKMTMESYWQRCKSLFAILWTATDIVFWTNGFNV